MTGVWVAADTITAARMNEKTIFQGTGAAISALTTTYTGMLAFCNTSGSGFSADYTYIRNAANDAWTNIPNKSATELNSTPVTDDTNDTDISGQRVYAFLTLPRSAPYYTITGIEWKNGTAVTGDIMCGVDTVDAIPPVSTTKTLMAYASAATTQTGTNVIQRNSDIISQLIPGGTVIGFWIATSSTGDIRELAAQPSQTYRFTYTYSTTPALIDTTVWGTWTSRPYIKVYYKAVNI